MDLITQQQALAAAGAAGGPVGDPVYVDDVFSTFLYDGTGSTKTITNGIDLSGEGGLVWVKNRAGNNHRLVDTERGATKSLQSDLQNAESTETTGLTAFTSSGFTVGSLANFNNSSDDIVSWTFRKAPKFFDVVTYTGNANNTTTGISHNLGSVPGMIIVKRLDSAGGWVVWHKSMGQTDYVYLHEDYAKNKFGTNLNYFTATAPTASKFFVHSSNNWVNNSAAPGQYVAYLFADDEAVFGENRNKSSIKCGSYTGTGAAGNQITLGFEPQWLLIKNTSSVSDWVLLDNQRGIYNGFNDPYLSSNNSNSETTSLEAIKLTPTGFDIQSTDNIINTSGDAYIYMAICRPHKPPSAGTDVLHVDAGTNNSQDGVITTGFPVDLALFGYRTLGGTYSATNRLTGFATSATQTSGWGNGLTTSSTSAESTGSSPAYHSPDNTTIKRGGNGHNAAGVSGFFFKRAPGVFDLVTYVGDGTGSSTGNLITHNLGVAPEMIVTKNRDSAHNWFIYHAKITDFSQADVSNINYLDFTTAQYAGMTSGKTWSVSATQFNATLAGTNAAIGANASGDDYIAWLFATKAGISKVGSYEGTGSAQTIDCGFTNGARLVIIKCIDRNANWYVWDSARGINASASDPYLFLSATTAETTTNDYIDPHSSGFTITSGGSPDNTYDLNQSGKTHIFLAFA